MTPLYDNTRLLDTIGRYRSLFDARWPQERYKWQAVRHFREHWRPDAADFPAMLERSLAKTRNLLSANHFYAQRMILRLAESDPEAVRALFARLFDEETPLDARCDAFIAAAGQLCRKHDPGNWKNHFQNLYTASVYLWLHDPDRHYVYKPNVCESLARQIGAQLAPRGSRSLTEIYALYDAIRLELKSAGMGQRLADVLTPDCYPDPELVTLTVDFVYAAGSEGLYSIAGKKPFAAAGTPVAPQAEIAPEEPVKRRCWWLTANPKIWSMTDWEVGEEQDYTLYNEEGRPRRIFRHFLDARAGDPVICYEGSPTRRAVALAVVSRPGDGERIWFRKTEQLAEPVGLARLHADATLAGAEFFTNPRGTLFELRPAEYEAALRILRGGEPLPAPAAKGPEPPHEGPQVPAGPSAADSAEDSVGPQAGASGAAPTAESPAAAPTPAAQEPPAPYADDDFLGEVYLPAGALATLRGLLRRKKNLILQGAPGVGKTFAARRLAYAVMGCRDDSRIGQVQFHQNYTYEDFVMGYRPAGEGFALREGIFYRFCMRAAQDPSHDYFLLIDEINRGNPSKIFGELLMLIEPDYRGQEILLAYDGRRFAVPANLHIIGMMNTADRSLAMIDYALRRRFSFFDMAPAFDSEGFRARRAEVADERFDRLADCLVRLNAEIADDDTLGPGFRIGHSYLCTAEPCTAEWLREVVDYDLVPLLREYWFDNGERVEYWERELHDAVL